jgi:hypothetical protein
MTMHEYQFFESIIEKNIFLENIIVWSAVHVHELLLIYYKLS